MNESDFHGAVVLVNKQAQRAKVMWPASMKIADCYQATNVRDFSTWQLAQANVPEEQASVWLMGNDLALDSIR